MAGVFLKANKEGSGFEVILGLCLFRGHHFLGGTPSFVCLFLGLASCGRVPRSVGRSVGRSSGVAAFWRSRLFGCFGG